VAPGNISLKRPCCYQQVSPIGQGDTSAGKAVIETGVTWQPCKDDEKFAKFSCLNRTSFSFIAVCHMEVNDEVLPSFCRKYTLIAKWEIIRRNNSHYWQQRMMERQFRGREQAQRMLGNRCSRDISPWLLV